MISLSKYEIENKHKGQDLGSVGGGGWGVLTISDSKNSATLHALCADALSCRSLRCLCSVFIISKVFKSTRPLCLNWNCKIKKPAKKQLISDVYVYEISSHTNACAMQVINFASNKE